jgi:3-oxoacyl-[acyl-carrier protein] reductase
MRLEGKRALVTGASRGIGAAIAKALAADGANVAIPYEKSADAASEVVDVIKSAGRQAVAIQADSAVGAVGAAVGAFIEATVSALGGLDILVNNVGIIRLADLDALLAVNVRAPVLACQSAVPHLSNGGRIINIGSYFADRVPGGAGLTVYAMTKSALIAFTKGLAREVGPQGVTVNLVQPGSVDTDMNPAHGPFGDALRSITAVGRYGKAQEIADAVVFLASPAASYITGASLTVDGGATA